uniref:Helicase/UvrB N-terminal domain-containing protein n=1 Tax=Plectus sambesii TaxID=2011161 RepID=A0A914VN96_9BILA
MVFRNNEVDKQFFTPRDYQLELVEKAINRNIIVPLGTGSGKTFIGVMLIREFASELHIPLEQGGKRSFFLVDKVPLVKQQADHIEHHTNLTVGKFHGKMNVDYYTESQWRKIIKENQARHIFLSFQP